MLIYYLFTGYLMTVPTTLDETLTVHNKLKRMGKEMVCLS